VQQGLITEACPFLFVWNFTEIRDVVRNLSEAFPPTALHAFAAKANPVLPILKELNSLGMGCETASIGEFTQALRCFPSPKIVFDSPCKSQRDLETALRTNALINLDNFQELQRVAALKETRHDTAAARIGLRINPQTGAGNFQVFSTATKTSKFGIPLSERVNVLAACAKYPWITALMVHTGSQGCGLDLLVAGIRAIVDIANEIPNNQITTIDIGGGLPVNFASDDYTPSFTDYAERLRSAVPELFTPRYRIVTEFGRAVLAKAGVILSRIEYTKEVGGRHIASQHAGVDVAIRTVWAPKEWPLRIEVFDAAGNRKITPSVSTDIAGPCCLGGDLLAQDRLLPLTEPGDLIAVRDVGAYYHSSYSYYNLRQAPPLYAYRPDVPKGSNAVTCLLPGHSIEQTLSFMSHL
jgi:diaminopimelate decarboxylase